MLADIVITLKTENLWFAGGVILGMVQGMALMFVYNKERAK